MNALTGLPCADDQHPDQDDILAEVLDGLSRQPRRLSPKFFYDARGSELFEEICRQPEYYLTDAELALMQAHVQEMADAVGPDVRLVEYGSGSGLKTRLLLQHLQTPVAYVPVEISRSALDASVARLGPDFPQVQMLPVVADFTQPVVLPRSQRQPARTVVYFPGSTIGNFDPDAAESLLRGMRRVMGDNGALLLGVDRVKEPAVIEAAYNDAAGVTARFTLNMLERFNRELNTDFDLASFRHRADYNEVAERIETRIESLRDQQVHVDGKTFHFAAGERMLVELSCKYSEASLAALAGRAGLQVANCWSDPQNLFSVYLLHGN